MAEFNIRLFAFKRMCEREDMLFREVSYYALVGSHLDPKILPKTKQQFWSLGFERIEEKNRLKRMKEVIKRERSKYINRGK